MTTGRYGALELAVLTSVARLAAESYGLAIQRDLVARTGHEYAVGAIYTTLGRLERKGLVGSTWSAPQATRGGRSRRHFHLTAAGTEMLRTARERETARWAGLDHLLTPETR